MKTPKSVIELYIVAAIIFFIMSFNQPVSTDILGQRVPPDYIGFSTFLCLMETSNAPIGLVIDAFVYDVLLTLGAVALVSLLFTGATIIFGKKVSNKREARLNNFGWCSVVLFILMVVSLFYHPEYGTFYSTSGC